MTRKLIRERNLPLSANYTLVGLRRSTLEGGDAFTCENCDKIITNLATVENEKDERFIIGLDCLKTLQSNQVFKHHEFLEVEFFNSCLKFWRQMIEADSVTTDEHSVFISWKNAKGRKQYARESRRRLTDYGFEFDAYITER